MVTVVEIVQIMFNVFSPQCRLFQNHLMVCLSCSLFGDQLSPNHFLFLQQSQATRTFFLWRGYRATSYKCNIFLYFLPLENIGVNGKPNQPQNSPYCTVICDLTTIVIDREVAFHLFSHQCQYYIPCNKMLFYFTQQNVTTV